MLKLKGIKKTYEAGELKVHALKGVDIEFRKSEFVSVLGPSGCGKTTLLNIIGGLDRYTSGDLLINGRSTKDFKDKDWDNYRNHSVGFVFQTYNLIPHQTVLENVELALTLSGVSRSERKKRAVDVLTRVGLADKVNSKPNQLSGGQMQRVAIARALVNDPDIILADEPTGALDSATSVQVMEILKEISKDRLIVMVTHNPELAKTYSTRIVTLLDGELTGDSNPMSEEEIVAEKPLLSVAEDKNLTKRELNKKYQKKRMSYWTALSLSFKNLLTKKGRTILVAIAGSIGIIGIALILAISSGFSMYVNKMQEDTLSTYPITIEAKSIDFSSVIMSMFLDNEQSKNIEHDTNKVYPKDSISKIMDSVADNLKPNNLAEFKKYMSEHYNEIENDISAVQYTYDIGLEFYLLDNTAVEPGSPALMNMIIKYALFYFQKQTNVELEFGVNNSCVIKPTQDMSTTFMDNYTELSTIKEKLLNGENVSLNGVQVVQLVFAIMGFSGSSSSVMSTFSSSSSSMSVFSEVLDNDKFVKSQYDIISGEYATEKNEAMLVLDQNAELDDYILYALGLVTDDEVSDSLRALVNKQPNPLAIDYDTVIGKEYKILTESDYYVEYEGDIVDFRIFNQPQLVNEVGEKYNNPQYNPMLYITYKNTALNNTTNSIKIVGVLRQNKSTDVGSIRTGVVYTDKLIKYMVEDYTKNSLAVTSGSLDEIKLDNPDTINIYVNTFEAKSRIKEFINKYNEQAENGDEISYSDIVGMIMSTVSTIINAITYVLIAFVSVSLVVSSIMIGIITYISVIERTKEIGVLRSIGASKKDIKRVFNAESFIIGLSSGLFGILVTVLFTIPINIILKIVTGIGGVASLPIMGAIVLIIISVCLTLIAGFIPSRIAAKKDPVVALRTE